MPRIRNASLRHTLLDQLLRECAQNPMNKEELTDELNHRLEQKWESTSEFTSIATRTVEEDLRTMRKIYGVTIEVHGRRNATYSYPDSFTSIHHQGLTPEAASDVRKTLRKLLRFVSHDQFQFLTNGMGGGSLANLFRLFIPGEENRTMHLLEQAKAHVLFDSNIEEYPGNKWLDVVVEAIAESRILRLQYRTFSGKSSEFDFHPYILKQYNNRWYCFGHDPEPLKKLQSGSFIAFEYKHIALDRIIKIRGLNSEELRERSKLRPRQDEFIKSNIDWEGGEFNRRIGVSQPFRPDEVSDIKIKFTERQFGYERTKPLHHSFRIETKHHDKSVTCAYKLQPNVEFLQRVCALRDQGYVVSPPWLRESVKQTIQSMAQRYES